MKNATLALLGGIIGSILYSWLGGLAIFLAVWVFMAIICYRLIISNAMTDEEEAVALVVSIAFWCILIPFVFLIDRVHFCKFFNIPHFEFRSPIHIIKETEEE